MAIQLATTDLLSRVPSAAGAASTLVASDVAASSPFDLLLLGSNATQPVEQIVSAVESSEGQVEDSDKDGSDPQAQAIVAPVVVLQILPLDSADDELPQELVISTAAEPVTDSLAFAADGKLAADPAPTPDDGLAPAQQATAENSPEEPASTSPENNRPGVVRAAEGIATLDSSVATGPTSDKLNSSATRDLKPPEVANSRQTDPPTAGTITATDLKSAAEPPAASALGLQPALSQPSRTEDQRVASSQPIASELQSIDTARLLHRVARAFAATKDGGEVRLRLSPPELGALLLDVRVQDGTLVARLEAETTSVRTVLVENLPALRDRLAEQGIRIERFDVDLRQPGGGSPDWSAHQPFQESSSSGQPARERRLPQVAEGVVARTTRVPAADALSHDLRRLNVIV